MDRAAMVVMKINFCVWWPCVSEREGSERDDDEIGGNNPESSRSCSDEGEKLRSLRVNDQNYS